MIYKRFGNPHIKLWNNELERLFKFKSLPRCNSVVDESNADGVTKNGKKIQNVDDLDQSHLKDIMSQKILKPIQKVSETQESSSQQNFQNPIFQKKPISIETALIYGESDRFYSLLNQE